MKNPEPNSQTIEINGMHCVDGGDRGRFALCWLAHSLARLESLW